jgi:hypothetical protein
MSPARGLRLNTTKCVFCEGEVGSTEKPRRIRPAEAGPTFEQVQCLIVADAMCLACRAKYLGWIDARAVVDGAPQPYARMGDSIMDLSFRSTFSDEPGPDDMPLYSVTWVPKLEPWPVCERCGKPRADDAEIGDDDMMKVECSDPECNHARV